jgi:hypothetical protein
VTWTASDGTIEANGRFVDESVGASTIRARVESVEVGFAVERHRHIGEPGRRFRDGFDGHDGSA